MAEETKSALQIAAGKKATKAREERIGKGKTAAQLSTFNTEVDKREANLLDLRSQFGSNKSAIDEARATVAEVEKMRRGGRIGRSFTIDESTTGIEGQQHIDRGIAAQGVLNRFGEQESQISTAQSELEKFRSEFAKNDSLASTRLERSGFGKGKIEQDILSGAKFGETILGDKGLGRLQEDEEIQESLLRFKQISEQGLSAQEVEAERTQLFQGIDRNTQTALRGLQARLASSGVRGGTAGSQLGRTAIAGAGQKTEVERDLFLKSAEAKRQGLIDFSERQGAVKTFDLAQEAREKDIILQAGLGQAQLGVSERSAKDAAAAQERAAAAKSGGGK